MKAKRDPFTTHLDDFDMGRRFRRRNHQILSPAFIRAQKRAARRGSRRGAVRAINEGLLED